TFVTLVDRAPSNNDDSVRDLYVAGNNTALGAVAGKYIKETTPDAQVVVIRGLPIPIDQQRQDGFDKAIEGSNVKVLEKQFGNWNRDDAFKVMQDYLTKYQRSEEHTSNSSHVKSSYAVFCLKKKKRRNKWT